MSINMIFENNPIFWQRFDLMLVANELTMKYPKGSMNPKYGNAPLPVNLGFLVLESIEGKSRTIEVFYGQELKYHVDAIVLIYNSLTCKIEMKLVTGCNIREIRDLSVILNRGDHLKCLVIPREKDIESIVGEIK